MKSNIKLAIADDHALLRTGLLALCETMEDVTVVGDMGSGEEAINFARIHKPDIFLIDIMMGGMTGIEAARWIQEQTPNVKVILISAEVNKEFITTGIKSGIHGYMNKNIDKEILHTALITVMRGERYFSPEISALVFQDFYLKQTEGKGLPMPTKTSLSKRELQVLTIIALGKTTREIAEELFISIKTVETHRLHIQDKLGLSNTAQLVRYAIERDMIEIKKQA